MSLIINQELNIFEDKNFLKDKKENSHRLPFSLENVCILKGKKNQLGRLEYDLLSVFSVIVFLLLKKFLSHV